MILINTTSHYSAMRGDFTGSKTSALPVFFCIFDAFPVISWYFSSSFMQNGKKIYTNIWLEIAQRWYFNERFSFIRFHISAYMVKILNNTQRNNNRKDVSCFTITDFYDPAGVIGGLLQLVT